MKFFTKIFNSIKTRSSLNFQNNLFFIKNMLSTNLEHTLITHFFLPFKQLKIKFLKNNFNNLWYNLIIVLSIFMLILSLIVYF